MQIPDLGSFGELIQQNETIQVKQRPDLFHFKLKLTLTNGSVLYVRENHLPILNWREYSYQWQTSEAELIIRWDNAHERYLLSVPPFHQHIGSEENVLPSEPMTLEKVLTHIANHYSS